MKRPRYSAGNHRAATSDQRRTNVRSLRFANRPRHVGRVWLFVGLVAAATLALTGSCRRNYPNRRARRKQHGRLRVELGPSLVRAVGGNVTVQRLRGECQRPGRHWRHQRCNIARVDSVAAGTIAGLLEPASWRRHHRATDSLRPARTGTAGRASQVVSPPHDWKF